MAFLTQSQVKEIVRNAPQGAGPKEIIDGLVSRGHTLEGYPSAEPSEQIIETPELEKSAEKDGFLSKLGEAFTGGIEDAEASFRESQEAFTRGDIGRKEKFLEDTVSAFNKMFLPTARAGEEVVTTITDPLVRATESVLESVTAVPAAKLREAIGEEKVQAINTRIEQAVEDIKNDPILQDPEVQRALRLSGRFVESVAAPIAAVKAPKAAISGVKEAARVTKEVAPIAKEAVKRSVEVAAKPVVIAKEKLFPTQSLEEITGKIVQGKKADIADAKKALSLIDTKGITTFEDLGNTMREKVKSLSGKVDEVLDADPAPIQFDELVRVDKTPAGKEIKTNFLDKSLTQLDELYTKIDDPVNAERIREVAEKAKTTGLSLKEVNDVAREYGVEFRSKAFSKQTGEPLTSVNAQSFENVRKGIKDTVRQRLPDETSKVLDSEIASLLNTERLVRKMEEKANALTQKVQQRGLIEKAFRAAGRAADVATFGAPRAFLTSFLPSNIGNKVMNSLDVEEALKKNLKMFEKLNKVVDNDESFIQEVSRMLKEQDGILKNLEKETVTFEQNIEIPDQKGLGKAGIAEKSLIDEAKKFKSAEDFRNRVGKENRNKLSEMGIRSLEQYERFWKKAGADKIQRKLEDLNPTGTVHTEHNPKFRATAPLGENITTLDKTMGKSPTETITIYRGVPKGVKDIEAGDFISTSKEIAKSYTGDGNVLSKKVKLSEILDDITEPLGEEYIYRP